MKLKETLQSKISMTLIQRKCMIIITILVTLLILTIWPRFYIDAMRVEWWIYSIFILIFAIPLFKKN
jgi:hypothetical protein